MSDLKYVAFTLITHLYILHVFVTEAAYMDISKYMR